MRPFLFLMTILFLASSCASKKEILYLQDSADYDNTVVQYTSPTIQPNDVLRITVGALVEETAIPYNKPTTFANQGGSVEMMQLEGYLVTEDQQINFPQLGFISTANKTVIQLRDEIAKRLEDEGHLVSPTVNVRLLNAKVTVLGEVNTPGTYNFTEQNISILQALGYAGDLTINGKREDIILVREIDGVHKITHLNLTSAELLKSPYYFIKPNDVIVVNPNNPKVKSAGFVGNTATVISVVSILLSTVVLITR
ncbi:polysaccharide biosynthesis/export family protein [uncultured Psychroserpens sp.]|uniref:polysaccharide biosynthesis/export family protein n=1 Tax=uncultured Psychroserpens sp. TaxID=255436 RepID=UPI00262F17A0|nr:polysaccharide biosynthesis/export family protein [uncultured Psychroserpens sp.]